MAAKKRRGAAVGGRDPGAAATSRTGKAGLPDASLLVHVASLLNKCAIFFGVFRVMFKLEKVEKAHCYILILYKRASTNDKIAFCPQPHVLASFCPIKDSRKCVMLPCAVWPTNGVYSLPLQGPIKKKFLKYY
jgi:hypothetical protein